MAIATESGTLIFPCKSPGTTRTAPTPSHHDRPDLSHVSGYLSPWGELDTNRRQSDPTVIRSRDERIQV